MSALFCEKTNRGFNIIKFQDMRNETCSLQESSSAMQPCIWLGPDDIKIKYFTSLGWKTFDLNEEFGGADWVSNSRMHLSQEQVKSLLPALIHFAETGQLPENTEC